MPNPKNTSKLAMLNAHSGKVKAHQESAKFRRVNAFAKLSISSIKKSATKYATRLNVLCPPKSAAKSTTKILGGAMKINKVGKNLLSKLSSKISLEVIRAVKMSQKKQPTEKKKSENSGEIFAECPAKGTIKLPTMGINHAGLKRCFFIALLNQKLITKMLKMSCKNELK